jgi:hydrophobe/amphiphile efflux-3 (HAE3) family protein
MLGIDIAYAIHVLSRYYEERRKGLDPYKSALRSVVTVGVAVFLTAATTAFGFASFGISNMPPIQQFGGLCVAGVMFSFVLAVTLLPACLVLRDRRQKSIAKWEEKEAKRDDDRQGIVDKVLVKVAIVSEHHRKIVLAVTTLILLGCIALGTQVSTEADMQKMMPADTPSSVAQVRINEHFGGQDLAYTLVKGDIIEPGSLNTILKYEDGLAASGAKSEKGELLFERDKIISLADLVQKANNGSIPQTNAEVMAVLMSMSTGSKAESSNRLINPKHPDVTMINIRIARGPQNDMKKMTETIRAENKKIMGEEPGLKLTSSGLPVLMTDLMSSIVPTQLKTSGLALILCALIVILVFNSLFFGLAATSVVFIGIALEIGALVVLGWPLDFMTVMVSSLVIGAGIDFGIHVTHRFREEWHHGGVEIDEAMRRTIGNVGKALIAAAITTAGAFAIIAISRVSYMRRFGGITALSLTFALLASLLVLPSILAWRAASVERKREKKAATETPGA